LNHHVLVADLALQRSGGRFLPEVDAIVIDEAHDFEDVAAEHLGARASRTGLSILLGRLWSERGTGLLRLTKDEGLRKEVTAVRDAARGFFEDLQVWTEHAVGGAVSGRAVRYGDGVPVDDPLTPRLRRLVERLEAAAALAATEDVALELKARARALEGTLLHMEALTGKTPPGDVRWVESSARGAVTLASAPVDVGARLRALLWEKTPTVVLTSATLAAGDPPSFAYLRTRLGIDRADEIVLGSPFDYGRQARVVVRSDLPDPTRDHGGYEEALPAAVLEAVRATRGGAFVLFTSVASMRAVAGALREPLEADGLQVLVQGEGMERPEMIARFKERDSALFGVSSFWQGVDVPGERLRHVVIARLPFEVPTHPLQEARAEAISQGGGNAFSEMSLPTAALRLKQGFGRLIRRATDSGTVTILDPRIVTKSYGRFLLGSLPECPVDVRPPAST
jgi:ATP-dependent DNA helicase DinG